jgi:hypothetical protein
MKALLHRIVAHAALLALLTGGLQAAKPKKSAANHEELEKTLMGSTWTFNNPVVTGGMKDMRFWSDSAVTLASQPQAIMGIWHVDPEGQVNILYGRGSVIKLSFNESAGTYTGEEGPNHSISGRRLEKLLPPGAVKKMQPVPAEISSGSGQAKIDVIAQQASTITAGIIVPLDATALDHRAAVTALRDDLADEAAAHPAASPETYQTAGRLCNAWLICLDERDKRLASYSQARPSSIMGASHATTYRPGDYFRYLNDVTAAHHRVLEELKTTEFYNTTEMKQWADRCVILRQGLDNLQAQVQVGVQQRNASK